MTKDLLRMSCVVSLWSAAMWLAWLGWDHSCYEVNGAAQGPYLAWQVVGCAASVAMGAVGGYWRKPGLRSVWVLAAAGVAGFALPWGWEASEDITGLWLVGLTMLIVGGYVGLSMLLGVVWLIRDADRSDGRLSENVVGLLAIVGFMLLLTPAFPLGVALLVVAAVAYARRRNLCRT